MTTITQNQSAAFKALDQFATQRTVLIERMAAAGYSTLETARPVVLAWACGKTGCRTTETTGGKTRLASSDKRSKTTATIIRDVMLMLQGTTRRKAAAGRDKREPSNPFARVVKTFTSMAKARRAFEQALLAQFGE